MKYVIPRNRLVPDPSFEDIIQAGARFKDNNGNPIGDPSTLYQGNDINFPRSAQLVEGMLFHYNQGMIYIPKWASYSDMYLNFSKHAVKSGITTVLAGGLESIIGELPVYLGAAVHTGIEQTLFPEKEHTNSHLKMLADELVKKGAIYLPGVQLVEMEYQIVPPTFFRKADHRFLFTYEKLNGERSTYGLHFQSSHPPDIFEQFISGIIDTRWQSEILYLTGIIQAEQIDQNSVMNSTIKKYQSLYGEQWREHIPELLAEFKEVCDAELERKGFMGQRLHAAILERIAPIVPYYRQVPRSSEMIKMLEDSAGNQQATTS